MLRIYGETEPKREREGWQPDLHRRSRSLQVRLKADPTYYIDPKLAISALRPETVFRTSPRQSLHSLVPKSATRRTVRLSMS